MRRRGIGVGLFRGRVGGRIGKVGGFGEVEGLWRGLRVLLLGRKECWGLGLDLMRVFDGDWVFSFASILSFLAAFYERKDGDGLK